VRATVAVVLAALGGALAAFIMAEYEFTGITPWAAALAVGVMVGELVASLGRWHGLAAMVVAAAVAGGSLLYGEWLESDRGIEPWAQVAWGAALLAAVVAAWNVRPLGARVTRRTSAGS
jgi:hypothetical protein